MLSLIFQTTRIMGQNSLCKSTSCMINLHLFINSKRSVLDKLFVWVVYGPDFVFTIFCFNNFASIYNLYTSTVLISDTEHLSHRHRRIRNNNNANDIHLRSPFTTTKFDGGQNKFFKINTRQFFGWNLPFEAQIHRNRRFTTRTENGYRRK